MPGLTHRLRLGFEPGALGDTRGWGLGHSGAHIPGLRVLGAACRACLLVLGWWDPWGWCLASPSSLIAGTVVCSGVGSPVPHPKASNSAFVLLQVPSARGRNPSL